MSSGRELIWRRFVFLFREKCFLRTDFSLVSKEFDLHHQRDVIHFSIHTINGQSPEFTGENGRQSMGAEKNGICGLGEFDRRAKKGDALTVVFFGGSLTWGANASDPNRTSYRALIGEKFRSEYPRARWKFIDAAIGGTGSQLGVYRVKRDVLRYKPDLVFLDFSLNDNMMTDTEETLCSYESIVRTLLAKGRCPVIPVFLASREYATLPELKVLKRRTLHLKLAKYYGLAVGDVVKGMNGLYRKDRLDVDAAWPPELFDFCHPHDFGYAIYADFVWKGYREGVEKNCTPVLPEKWINGPLYRNVLRCRIQDLKNLPEGWRIGMPETRAGTFDFLSSRWLDRVAIAENCVRKGFDKFEFKGNVPGSLKVRFRGSCVLLFGESTIFSGKLLVKIDGKNAAEIDTAKFGTMFTPSAYLNAPVASGLDPEKEHILELIPKLSKTKPQQIHLESICISGPGPVEVRPF